METAYLNFVFWNHSYFQKLYCKFNYLFRSFTFNPGDDLLNVNYNFLPCEFGVMEFTISCPFTLMMHHAEWLGWPYYRYWNGTLVLVLVCRYPHLKYFTECLFAFPKIPYTSVKTSRFLSFILTHSTTIFSFNVSN